jgi:hypothetical protein
MDGYGKTTTSRSRRVARASSDCLRDASFDDASILRAIKVECLEVDVPNVAFQILELACEMPTEMQMDRSAVAGSDKVVDFRTQVGHRRAGALRRR